MAGEREVSPLKRQALAALERGDEGGLDLIGRALAQIPYDGALLIAHAAALLRSGHQSPFEDLENRLTQSPDWVEGHKALARLKAEARDPNPLSKIEQALAIMPKHPRLWMAYLTLLASADRHDAAAQHAATLRNSIADLPELRLVEARHRGFAGQVEEAQALLADLPSGLPDLGFERARNAIRMGDLESASNALERVVKTNTKDIGAWALVELCWRAGQDPRHEWLCPGDGLFVQCDLGFSETDRARLADHLRALHTTRAAPLGQSVKGGTQTHGALHLRDDDLIRVLFASIDEALCQYSKRLPRLDPSHPLASLTAPRPRVFASWSILLKPGGQHVPHLHDGGLISSAAHIAVPEDLVSDEGILELGLPPKDIALPIEPIARFAPIPGHLVLFPSFVYHSTSRFSKGERLTVAFDAV